MIFSKVISVAYNSRGDSHMRLSKFGRIAALSSFLCLGIISNSMSAPLPIATPRAKVTASNSEPLVRVHRVGSYALSIPHNGTLGSGFSAQSTDPLTGEPIPSYEFPQGSHLEHMHNASIWIGGIVGNDTLVSVAADGWLASFEMIPSSILPGVRVIQGPADENYGVAYSDSLPEGGSNNSPSAVGILVEQTSRSWAGPPNDDIAIIEYKISNFRDDTIRNMWVGIYVDGDIVGLGETGSGFSDDVAGYLDEFGIAYITDNDGHPGNLPGNDTWSESSIRSVIGAKIIDFQPASPNPINFNWWASNGNINLDFGPRREGTEEDPFRDFGGWLGTPIGELNKYYILSHSERDYDQLEMALDHSGDGWLPPPDSTIAEGIARGADTRFLLSTGGIDLGPDDSIHFVIALSIGDGFHQKPTDFAQLFDPYSPNSFIDQLSFSDLISNIQSAESLYASGYDVPVYTPPPPPIVIDSFAESPEITWVYNTNSHVDGYDIFVQRIPDSLIFCNIAPVDTPSFRLDEVFNTELITSNKFTIEGLVDGAWYSIGVAIHPPDDSTPKISVPRVYRHGVPQAPQLVNAFKNEDQLANRYIVSGPEIQFTWTSAETDISHYNIFRSDTPSKVQFFTTPRIIHSYKVCESVNAEVICDSLVDSTSELPYLCATQLPPYSINPAESTTFADMIDSAAIYYFRVSAVDSAGNESARTEMFSAYTYPTIRKPLAVVLYDSAFGGSPWNFYPDSVYSYYSSQLDQYSPDYILFWPSQQTSGWPPDYSLLGNYEIILFDMTARLQLINLSWNLKVNTPSWIQKYLRSNGTTIYFGSGFNHLYESPVPGLSTARYSRSSLASELLGFDSTLLISRASHKPFYGSDSLYRYFNPIGANPVQSSEFPNADYHHSSFYSPSYFNEGPLPFKGVMYPRPDNTEVLYTYRSGREPVSQLHGLPVGIKYTPETHTAYTFFMEPWEMEPQQTQALFAALLGDIQTDVSEDSDAALPRVFSLEQNFPNPFNPSTEIYFSAPVRSHITLTVYNILGQKVATLVDEIKSAGAYSVQWDASRHASGIYFYQLRSGDTRISKKAVLLK